MTDHELTARMKELQSLTTANENRDILEAYNQAFVDGFQNWFSKGMKGSAMQEITGLMQQRGVIQ